MEDKQRKNDVKNAIRQNRHAGHKPRIREVRESNDSSEGDGSKRVKKARIPKRVKRFIHQQYSSTTVNKLGNTSKEVV